MSCGGKMNLTILFGNGFDLQFDLKTQYKDFYESHYFASIPENNFIKAEYKDDLSIENVDKWSDFENQVIQIAYKIKDKHISKKEEFIEDVKQVTQFLRDYLLEIDNLYYCTMDNSEKEKLLYSSLNGFFDGLQFNELNEIKALLSSEYNFQFNINFITLNYTETLSKIIGGVNNMNLPYNRGDYSTSVNPPIHLHGTLDYLLTLGISSIEQIDSSFHNIENLEDIIKLYSHHHARDGRYENVKAIIDNSDVIYLFGVSLGYTDKYIWKQVIDWLSKSDKRRLIINNYDNTHTLQFPSNLRIMRKSVYKRLLEGAGIEEDDELLDVFIKQVFIQANRPFLFHTEALKLKLSSEDDYKY